MLAFLCNSTAMESSSFIFRQHFETESSTYTYILADAKTNEAIIIDPVLETVDRDLKVLEELGLKLLYSFETHVHADHITGAEIIRKRTGAKTAIGKGSKVDCADILLEDGQELSFGSHKIRALSTPGHTDSCTSYVVGTRVFTGDTLLIRGTGRTDFQQGNSEKMFESVRNKLFTLPSDTLVYPAHDYKGMTCSSIGEEIKFNPRLGMSKTKEEFVEIMRNLKLADPKRIQEAVPANMQCGRKIG